MDPAWNFFGAHCIEDFGGGHDLPGVSLGVVGEMDEQASDGGGELFFADGTRSFEIGCGEGADALGCAFQSCIEFCK